MNEKVEAQGKLEDTGRGLLNPDLFAEASTTGTTNNFGITFKAYLHRGDGGSGVEAASLRFFIFHQGLDEYDTEAFSVVDGLAPLPATQSEADVYGNKKGLTTYVIVKNAKDEDVIITCNVLTK